MAVEKLKHFLKYILVDVILAALLSFVLINYVVSAYRIEGDSMSPLLHGGERVFISKFDIREKSLKRFDIVVLYRPDEPDKSLIKRIVGLPGEIIELRNGGVFINYELIKQPFHTDESSSAKSVPDFPPLLIPRGHYFVLGDNRAVSRDSRRFGSIPQKYIFGRAFFRYWPFERFGKIE